MPRRSFWRNLMLESIKENMLEEVSVISLKRIVNERGHLLEVQRSDDHHYLGLGQAYVTSTIPGVVKAWYRHSTQHIQITLLKGSAGHLVASALRLGHREFRCTH
jgi:dTDP-4-dehydrorhamnose 3,5-epimerase-like enzyme